MVPARDGKDGLPRESLPRFSSLVRQRIHEAGVPVHAFLSGHEHNLQVIDAPAESPRLHVVAGAGSQLHPIRTSNPDLRFAMSELGFARIDLAGEGARARLIASLFVTSSGWLGGGRPLRLVASWTVDAAGRTTPLVAAGATDAGRPDRPITGS
jgi:hypothetical protein